MFITTTELQCLKDFLKHNCGVVLANNKQFLVANRLHSLMMDIGIEEVSDLLTLISVAPNNDLVVKTVNAITTNEIFWFREALHFQHLEKKLLAKLTEKKSSISVWSVASSSGEEAYSISLSIDKYMKASGQQINAKVTATDCSVELLNKAKAGIYTHEELSRGLPNELREEHFSGVRNGLQISLTHRSRVSFYSLNLSDSFSSLGQFDIIFCRNVLPYFPDHLQLNILNRLIAVMKPGAYLFVCSSEKFPANIKGLDMIREAGCKFYRKA